MIQCYNCGTDNLDGSEYCDECGKRLSAAANQSINGAINGATPSSPARGNFVSPPPPSFTRETVAPKPATPYTPPPPPPVKAPVKQSAPPTSAAPLPPPPPITSVAIGNTQSDQPQSSSPQNGAPRSSEVGGQIGELAGKPRSGRLSQQPKEPNIPHTAVINGQTGPIKKGGVGGISGSDSGQERHVMNNNTGEAQTRAKLVIQRGGKVGKEFSIISAESMIGRWDADGGIFPDVDLDQDDPEAKVSRRHARIQFINNQYVIEDLGSTNGTFINRGPRLLPGNSQPLSNGDEIIVGKTFLKFVLS